MTVYGGIYMYIHIYEVSGVPDGVLGVPVRGSYICIYIYTSPRAEGLPQNSDFVTGFCDRIAQNRESVHTAKKIAQNRENVQNVKIFNEWAENPSPYHKVTSQCDTLGDSQVACRSVGYPYLSHLSQKIYIWRIVGYIFNIYIVIVNNALMRVVVLLGFTRARKTDRVTGPSTWKGDLKWTAR